MYKCIRQSIVDRSIEPELSETERTANLYFIDSILLYVKLMSLHILERSRHNTAGDPREASDRS